MKENKEEQINCEEQEMNKEEECTQQESAQQESADNTQQAENENPEEEEEKDPLAAAQEEIEQLKDQVLRKPPQAHHQGKSRTHTQRRREGNCHYPAHHRRYGASY